MTMISKMQQKLQPYAKSFYAFFVLFFVYSPLTQAGGLDTATDTIDAIRAWAYTFLGIAVFLYLIYQVAMALLDRKQWADVLVSVGYVAIAGAVLVIADWAWNIWGS